MQTNRWTSAFVVIGLVLGSLAIWGRTAPGQAPAANPRVTWEYQVVPFNDSELLQEPFKKLGEDGWELVTIDRAPPYAKPNFCIFKRPRR